MKYVTSQKDLFLRDLRNNGLRSSMGLTMQKVKKILLFSVCPINPLINFIKFRVLQLTVESFVRYRQTKTTDRDISLEAEQAVWVMVLRLIISRLMLFCCERKILYHGDKPA